MPARILFVVGMHRSGTSALCAALNACGISFGGRLLDAMAGVNEEGFWEDENLVALNERLLGHLGGTWYCPPAGLDQVDWAVAGFAGAREQACALLRADTGRDDVRALKDPRLCLTLPFWLGACADVGASAAVVVIGRAPLEVARSLEKRDGFPLGYGLRLDAFYRAQLRASLPSDSLFVSYDALLQEPATVVARIAGKVGVAAPASGALDDIVKSGLRHHSRLSGSPLLLAADDGSVDLDALRAEIESDYPGDATLAALAAVVVDRGEQLTRLGSEHTAALATLRERDADIAGLSAEHRRALATIEERDDQIREFDRRLAETGNHLSRALDTLNERDAQIARVLSVPVLGWLVRAVWAYDRR